MRASIFAFFAAVSFVGMSTCVHGLSDDLSGITAVCFRTGFGALIAFATLKLSQTPIQINNKRVMTIRVIAGTIALCAFFQALRLADLATITLLKATSPIAVSLMAWLFLGETIGRRQFIAIPLALIGVGLIVLRPGMEVSATADQTLGIILATIGTLLAGVAYVCLRKLGETENPLTIVAVFALVAFIVSLPFAIHDGIQHLTLSDFWILLGAGVFGTLGQLFITHAYKAGKATRVTIITLVQVPLAALVSWLLFGESLGSYTWLGGLLIVVSVVLQTKAKANAKEPDYEKEAVETEKKERPVALAAQ